MTASSEIREKGGRQCCPTCRAIYRSGFVCCPTDGASLETFTRDPMEAQILAGRYVIDECIGEGAMGRVYRAHHQHLERRQFAIKILLGDLAANPTMRIRFAQEAQAASRLDHPNVVSIIDFGKSDAGLMYIVMELVRGDSLADLIERKGRLSERTAIEITRQLCRGLAHAHEQGLIHRDFKPDNVSLTPRKDGVLARILDFGLAIPEDPDDDAPRLTDAGLVVGTPAYASPEQISGGAIDHRADLFALGAVMHEMVSGIVPFGGSTMSMLQKISKEQLPRFADRFPSLQVSSGLERIIRRLLSKRPDDRFTEAMDVLDALDAHEARESSVDLQVVANPAPTFRDGFKVQPVAPPAPSSRRPLIIIGLSAVLSAGLLYALLVHDRDEAVKPPPRQVIVATSGGGDEAPVPTPDSTPASERETTQPPPTADTPDEADSDTDNARGAQPDTPTDSSGDPTGDGDRTGGDEAARDSNAFDSDEPAVPPSGVTSPPARPSKPDPERRDRRTARAPRQPAAAAAPNTRQPSQPGTETAGGETVTDTAGPADATEPADQPAAAPKRADPEPTPVAPPPGTTRSAIPLPTPSAPSIVPEVAPTPPPPASFDANVSVDKLDARGSLTAGTVSRAIERAVGSFRDCYRDNAKKAGRSPGGSLAVTLTIDEQGRARQVDAGAFAVPGVAACVEGALGGVRTRIAPDVGTVAVSFAIRFVPVNK